MGDGLMQRMSRGRGQCQLNVHGLDSLINVTARSSDEESFQSRKQSSTHEKKGFSLGNEKRFVFFQIFSTRHWWRWWRSPRPRRRWWKPCCPQFTPGTSRFPGGEGTRCSNNIDATHWGASKCPRTLWNWPLPRRMQKWWDLTLSKAPLRSAWRHWTCQASTARRVNPPQWPLPFVPACRSDPVTPPAFSGEELARQSTRTRWTRAASRGALGR